MKKEINLLAEFGTAEEFRTLYSKNCLNKKYDGESLLYYALSNNNCESRYLITKFLVNEGADVKVLTKHRETMLHMLLMPVNHILTETISLCNKFIQAGVDMNQADDRGRLALQYLVNMKYTDEELAPIYDVWFEQPGLIFDKRNVWGKSPIDLIKVRPFRNSLLERIYNYEEIQLKK